MGVGVVLNQVKVLSKENETSAAPKVLADVALQGQIVTGDAMFMQRDLSSQIVLGLLPMPGFSAIAAARRRFNALPAVALALVLYTLHLTLHVLCGPRVVQGESRC